MKITATQYARALYQSVKDKSQQETDESLENFTKVLRASRQTSMLAKIIEKFSEIWDEEHGIVRVKTITKKPLSAKLEEKIKKFISRQYETKDVTIENEISENIKGGIIIKAGDEVWDGSVGRQLDELRKVLTG